MIQCRTAQLSDKERILQVTKTIWDGDDYIPWIIDQWLTDPAGRVIVVEYQGIVRGLVKYTRFSAKEGWLEGLRVEPAYQGKGLAHALTDAVMETALADGVQFVQCSTSVENYASQHLIRQRGFHLVGEFQLFEKEITHVAAYHNPCVKVAHQHEAIKSIEASRIFLCLSNHLFPMGWKFPTWSVAREWLDQKITAYQVGHQGFAVVESSPLGNSLAACFWDGPNVEVFSDWVITLAQTNQLDQVYMMIPQGYWLQVRLSDLGWNSWHTVGRPDVFVFRYDVEKGN